MTAAAWAAQIRAGDVRAAARLIRAIEDDVDAVDDVARDQGVVASAAAAAAGPEAVLRLLYPHSAAAFVVGITGPPGAGKSTLVDAMVARYRALGQRVGVIAVDPSSAFTGGAILGDRIRMQRHALDEGVFIRSLATRGQLGGLCRACADAVTVMAALGMNVVLVETVGVGQDEVDIAGLADLVAVVLVPGMGDDVQAIKAGVLEIADVFVVNKADRPGAEHVVADLTAMLALRAAVSDAADAAAACSDVVPPPICKTVAARDEGVAAVVAALADLDQRGRQNGEGARRRRRQALVRLRTLLLDRLRRAADRRLAATAGLPALADDVGARRLDPYAAVDGLLAAGRREPYL